jgi:transposase
MRKSHSKDFKAKVALEAIRNEASIQELSQKYDVHPTQIGQWKKQLIENISDIFERPNKKKKDLDDVEIKESELYKSIGQLQVENQFLKKKYKEIYGRDPD